MRLFVIIPICLLLYSCSLKQDVAGKYMSKNNPNYLQIKKGGSFIYEYRSRHLYKQATGEWMRVNKKEIVLNSKIKSTELPIGVKTLSGVTKDNNITIKVDVTENRKLSDYMCRVYVNDSIFINKRCDSLSSILVRYPIENIYLMFMREPSIVTTTLIPLPLKTKKYIPQVKTGNILEIGIKLVDSYFYYKVFNNDSLKIKNKGLKIFDPYKKKWEKLIKVSDETNIFARYNDQSDDANFFP